MFATLIHFAVLICIQFVTPDLEPSNPAHEVRVALNRSQSNNVSPSTGYRSQFSLSHEPSAGHVTQGTMKSRTVSNETMNQNDRNYYQRWETHVEDIGNRVYAKMPETTQLQGDLKLLVAINKNGTVHAIRILQSSGSPVLDQTAIQIVKNAAPFEALPAEISEEVDILEIVRTWQFRKITNA